MPPAEALSAATQKTEVATRAASCCALVATQALCMLSGSACSRVAGWPAATGKAPRQSAAASIGLQPPYTSSGTTHVIGHHSSGCRLEHHQYGCPACVPRWLPVAALARCLACCRCRFISSHHGQRHLLRLLEGCWLPAYQTPAQSCFVALCRGGTARVAMP